MRLLFLGLFFMTSQALALSRTSDITLSPTPMSWSGPADSIVPGNTIGSEWSATASVSEVFWCGLGFYLLQRDAGAEQQRNGHRHHGYS